MSNDIAQQVQGLGEHLGKFQRTAGAQIALNAADEIERLRVIVDDQADLIGTAERWCNLLLDAIEPTVEVETLRIRCERIDTVAAEVREEMEKRR